MTNPITLPDGTKKWKNENGQYHRDDGPAIIYSSGRKEWWKNGQWHRDDGPAIIRPDGTQSWFIKGKYYTFQEWLQLVPNKIAML
jgi:hypothetical protein